MIVATDLDRTLIYSRAAIDAHGDGGTTLRAVETYSGADASWMTDAAARAFAALHQDALVVPATTRTPAQWRRVSLPGPPARYVIAANGGILLVDGEADRSWDGAVAAQLAQVASLAEIWEHAGQVCHPDWTVKLRNASGLFCYAVLHRSRIPEGFLTEAKQWASARGWQLSLQGRKLYWVPQTLTKSAAITEVASRAGAERVVAAGDSLLDADLFDVAEAGIVARHGELVASGWQAPHVRITSAVGIRAGAEIVDWLSSA